MMFSFSFSKGDPATVFSDPYSIVLTEQMAEKYFQDEDPLGKILTVENQYDFKVTGVIESTPDNSTIGTEFYIPISFATIRANNENYLSTWYNCAFYTFAQLQKGADYREVNQKILKRIKQSHPESNLESFLFPFSRIHLHSISGRGGFISSLVIFSIIALAILAIAIINFVNLMTARSGKRIREVGLRKVVGARRSELIKQFYCESMLHALAACLLAGVLVELLLPTFESLLGTQLSMNFFSNPLVIPGLLAIALLTGILAGTYPALRLSGYEPVKAFRGTTMIKTRRSPFRRGLVVFQFVISISLIISTTVTSICP
jgi:ABC-type antimicrobial peptide transport system permease subunit